MKKTRFFFKEHLLSYRQVFFKINFLFLMRSGLCLSLFLLSINLLASTKSSGQTLDETKVNLVMTGNSSLKEVLSQLQKQTRFNFFYSSSSVNKQMLVKSRKNYSGSAEKLLIEVLENTGLTFYEKDNRVIIYQNHINATSKPEHQLRKVRGTVTELGGAPIVGVTIASKLNPSLSTTSDENGYYEINVSGSNDFLLFSFIGYKSQQIAVGTKDNISVAMEVAMGSLEEVVVVGYGTQKKATVTGSVAQVKGEDLVKSPVANVTNSLAGRLPGLRAVQRSGQPGSDASQIDIRGFGNALIIVDGMPSSMSNLDPNEIESVSIIKDASASVYGVRAANGVILVTTKRGKIGRPNINYSNYFGFQRINKYPDLVNAAQFAELSNESAMNMWHIAGRNSTLSLPYTAKQIEEYKNGTLKSYDWFNGVIKKNSPQSYHNLNVSGGTEDVKYFMNLGVVNQEGFWKSGATDYNRYNVRGNIEAKIANGLTVELNLMGRLGNVENPSTSVATLMNGFAKTFPTFAFYANDNPEYLGINNLPAYNPLVLTDRDKTGYDKRKEKEFNAILSLTYDIPKVEGLYAKASYAYNTQVKNQKIYSRKYNLYKYDAEKDIYNVGFTGNTPSNLSVSNEDIVNTVFQLSLNYKHRFADKHNFSGLFLFEAQEGNTNLLSAYRQYLIDGVDELFGGVGENQRNNGSSSESARLGYVGKLNYDFNNKYLAELAFRYDGTYKVMSGSKYGFFPNASVGWKINEENFLKDVSAIDLLKIRLSHGKVGDDEDIAAFQYMMGFSYPDGNYILGSAPIPGLNDRGLPNYNLTWYTSQTSNLGLEVALWKGLLEAEVDIFYRKRTGLLARRLQTLPNTFGASLPQENLNSDNHRGFEIVLKHRNKVGQLGYSISPNLSWTRAKYGYVERGPSTNFVANWKNNTTDRWKNLFWGYVAEGQFQNQEEINTAPIHDNQANKTILPGDIRYKDLNGDGIITDADQQIIGRNNTPELFYGLNLSVEFKNFDLSLLMQGASKFNAYFTQELQNPLVSNSSAYTLFMDRWHRADQFDPDSEWIAGKYPSIIGSGSNNNVRQSSFWLKDATYLRIKNFELGYSLDKEMINKLKIRNLRVYISGQNVLTFDKIKYIDPEAESGRGNYYPQPRIWTAGVNVGF